MALSLLGIPDKNISRLRCLSANLDGYDPAYAGYVQDDWKVTPRLTINYGIRYEIHPRFYDHLKNISNFLPNYQTIANGTSVLGGGGDSKWVTEHFEPAFCGHLLDRRPFLRLRKPVWARTCITPA